MTEESKVVNLAEFRKTREQQQRPGLIVDHATGKITGSKHMQPPQNIDFGDRLTRIRNSLEKINKLMGELKRMSATTERES